MPCVREVNESHNFLAVLSKGIGVWSLVMNFIYLSFLPSHDLPCLQGNLENLENGLLWRGTHTVPIWNNSFASLKAIWLDLREKESLVDSNESINKGPIIF